MPSPLKSPAEMILSPTFAADARPSMRMLDSVRRFTGPPVFSGPAKAAGAMVAHSAAVAPAQASARRRLLFNTTFPLLGRSRSMARPHGHHGLAPAPASGLWPIGGARTVRLRPRMPRGD